MNILAHLYLSAPGSEEMLGNFIGDFVKGKKFMDYPEGMQQGILLHRAIDSYTDNHIATKKVKSFFSESYGLYAGVVSDIIFDYCLANNWNAYSPISLEAYAKETYRFLSHNQKHMPAKVQHFLPFMIQNNWLLLYRSKFGIKRVLEGMGKRTSMPQKSEEALTSIIHKKREFVS